MKKYLSGFTLLELLIVVGILGILAVVLLMSLNPSESQKKSRDLKRMKDVSTLQGVIEQYVKDGNAPICTDGCDSASAGLGVGSQACDTNWMGVDLCKYANTLPVDPTNNTDKTCIGAESGGTATDPKTAVCKTIYRFKMSGSDYEFNVRQESVSNGSNTYNDGGNDEGWAEIGSSLDLL
jgi:prepilin-type N-terminal cleavage/methylation domain-containing protein